MNSRVPVRLEWDEASGKRSSAEAHTRIINPYGCMVVLPHALGMSGGTLSSGNISRSRI